MGRYLIALFIAVIAGGALFAVLTKPRRIELSALPKHTPSRANGKYIFYAGGCASCHAAPASNKCDDPKPKDKLRLAGGRCLKTPFGTFYVPNISPHKTAGIGGWSTIDFVNAMMRGVSPEGRHYYPAFPYTFYQRMRYQDVIDLKAYMDTLPAVDSKVPPHELPLLFRFRRGLGLWKLINLDGKQFVPDPTKSDMVNRGAYLVNGPGHCGACHSPRDWTGGIIRSRALSGADAAEGEGFVPNLTPHKDGLASWSAKDIADSLESGFTPEFDTFGGPMVQVQENMAKLTAQDRAAIAAYLKSLPAIASPRKKKSK